MHVPGRMRYQLIIKNTKQKLTVNQNLEAVHIKPVMTSQTQNIFGFHYY